MNTPSVIRIATLFAAVVLTTAPSGVRAGALPTPPNLADAGWTLMTFPGRPATRFTGGGDDAIEVVAESSAALLYTEVTGADRRKPVLTWRWRVDETLPATDLTRRGGDDRPLAVHICFPAAQRETGLWARLGGMVRDLAGGLPDGKVLTYVWGGAQQRGARFANPYLAEDGAMIVLRPGESATGTWYEERIDFRADFERVFGYPPPAPDFIAVSGDSDDTMGRSSGRIAGLTFRDRDIGFGPLDGKRGR